MSNRSSSSYTRRQALGLLLGSTVFILLLLLPPPTGLEEKAWHVTAITVLMGVWWVSEALHPSITALLPLVLFPFFRLMPPQEVSAVYADHIVFLFMGGFLIALAMEKWQLHRRIALLILSHVGGSPRTISLGFMLTTALISMWVSNTATTMIMLPIAGAILDHIDSQGYDTRQGFGTALMLMVAYGASIGGVGTPVGTPPNLIFLGALPKLFPAAEPVSFVQWMLFGFPTAMIMVLVTWAYLSFLVFPSAGGHWTADRRFLHDRLQELGPMTPAEKKVLAIAATTALLWITRVDIPLGGVTLPGWTRLLPPSVKIEDSTVAIGMALLLFLIPADRHSGTFLLDWDTAQRLPWGVLLLLGGGLALAAGVEKSGLAAWLGSRLTVVGELSPVSGILLVTLLTALITEFASNTATTTLMMPVLAATARAMQLDPLFLMVPATFAASICNFMLPSSTGPNAIIFASGHVTIPQMVRAGIGLDVLGAVVLTVLVYVLGIPVFGISLDGFPAWAGAAGLAGGQPYR
ncbi:MAG: DASS family sodium-coupled anion symporter [Candidatus Binatia bacterium]|nr:DASS family sodium-coupled anion symporter [Candidatus Binatia bacterium]